MNSFRSEYLKFIYNKWLLLTVLSTIILVPLFVIFLLEPPVILTKVYFLTQFLEGFYLGNVGFLFITLVVLVRLHQSTGVREKLRLKLLWMR